MRSILFLALAGLILFLMGCGDQPTGPDSEFTALFAKGGKPGKPPKPDPGGGNPPAPAIAFVAVGSSNDGGGTNQDLMVMDADGGNPTVLLHSSTYDFWFPAWCSDVNRLESGDQPGLVYERRALIGQQADLWAVEVEVTEAGVNAKNDHLLIQGGAFAECSPTANTMAYTKMNNWEDENPEGVWLYDMQAGTESLIVADPIPDDDEFDAIWSAWNPTGTAIAYQYCYEDAVDGYTCSLRYRDIASGSETIVREDIWFSALDWSRSGDKLAMKTGYILIVDAMAGAPEPRTLNNTGFADTPTFPPASGVNAAGPTELVFMNRRGKSGSGKRKIVLYNLLTDSETTLYERKGYHLVDPDWRR